MKTLIRYALIIGCVLPQLAMADAIKGLQTDGFATIGVQQVNQSGVRFGANTKNDPDWVSGSVLGVQSSYAFNPQWSVTGQFLVRPDESDLSRLAPKVEWLFAGYQLNDEIKLRAGQLRLPLYMYSEKLYVGKAYPMASLPTEVYGSVASNTYQGADVLWRTDVLTDMELLVQPYAGRFETSTLTPNKQDYVDVELKGLYGVNIQLQTLNENLKLRAGYFNSDLAYPGYPNINATLKTLGFNYLRQGWFLLGEFSNIKLSFLDLKETNGWYLLLGKRLGNWFPYASYGAKSSGSSAFIPSEVSSNTMTIGLSYDLNAKSSVKAELTHADYGINNTSTEAFYLENTMPMQGRGADLVRVSYSLLF